MLLQGGILHMKCCMMHSYIKIFLLDMQLSIHVYTLPMMNKKKAKIILKFLVAFLDATKVFSIFKYPTSNLYLKKVWRLRTVLMDASAHTDETLKQLMN